MGIQTNVLVFFAFLSAAFRVHLLISEVSDLDQEEEKQVIARINELYHLKEKRGLSAAEQAERKRLHKKFIANFRAGFKQEVEDLVIINKNGQEVTSEKAKRAQRRKGLRK